MQIYIENDKKRHMDLLLSGDEQEDMIEKYLERSQMFVLDDDGIKAQCCVVKENAGVYEIKNISVKAPYYRKGYGRALVEYVRDYYKDCKTLYAGTGESEDTMGFYRALGFKYSHRVKDFFINNYSRPIFEGGVQLKDMVYFKLSDDSETK